ncbi:hypothetical protein [Halalkalicoccus subterraneus]|uniref:hypothetical protein n=1 Tax=Halalkalicoccus subterraneus TaxID=2675002 RepID=UPI000EFCF148|nr:hypothetical protein [Halalkalicoccus subterraneus]
MRVEIDTDVTQLVAGTRLPAESTCTHCNHTFEAGDRCTIQATRQEDATTYTLSRLSCPDCAPEAILSPTLGYSEHLCTARLSGTAHAESLRFSDPQRIQTSTPSEGSTNTDDPITLVPTAELPDLTNTIYHLERDDEQATPLCNCSPDAGYARVALGDLETTSAHCCRTCLTVYQNEHETNPRITQGPSLAQIETSDSSTDDSVIITQQAMSPITRTCVQAQTRSQE